MQEKAKHHPRLSMRLLEEAMNRGQIVYINYSKGSTPGEYRGILPLAWIKRGVSFRAVDQRTSTEKMTVLSRVTDITTEYIPPGGPAMELDVPVLGVPPVAVGPYHREFPAFGESRQQRAEVAARDSGQVACDHAAKRWFARR